MPRMIKTLGGVKAKRKPSFEANTEIYSKGLYVDSNGAMWWIDPDAQTISPADVEN